jgi:hypothetical protein
MRQLPKAVGNGNGPDTCRHIFGVQSDELIYVKQELSFIDLSFKWFAHT